MAAADKQIGRRTAMRWRVTEANKNANQEADK